MFGWLKRRPGLEKTLGQKGEELAQAEYRKNGYEIIAANFFNPKGLRVGEVDFIAKNKTQLVFVEVKTRTGESRFGTGAEAVDSFKQKKILKAVKIFLLKHPELSGLSPQIDVCLIDFDPFDKTRYFVRILMNAVEDWG